MPQTEFESPEGYVPMAPVGRMSDYVSMDCKQGSIESGTPSTDTRFSDIHLDKVCAYLTPSEDEGPIERPTRAYSVGSRPDGLREKIDKYILTIQKCTIIILKKLFIFLFLELMLIEQEHVRFQWAAVVDYPQLGYPGMVINLVQQVCLNIVTVAIEWKLILVVTQNHVVIIQQLVVPCLFSHQQIYHQGHRLNFVLLLIHHLLINLLVVPLQNL